jgi:hypothetical protein
MQKRDQAVLAALVIGLPTYVLAASLSRTTTTATTLTSTITATVTVTTSDAYEQVANGYADHLEQVSARNIPAIPSGYESNATVNWTGVTPGMTGNNPGLAGNYSGSASIAILMGSFIGRLSNFSLANENQILGVEPDGSVVVNSTFNFRGYDALGGKINGTVIAQDVYERVGGSSWLISRETWNFTQFQGQFPLVSA